MKCSCCSTENNYNANYCKACGTAFSQNQKEESLKKTWIGKLNQVEDLLKWIKLDKITGHPITKGAVLLILLGTCLFNIFFKTNDFIIQETSEYQLQYNIEKNEYYLFTDLSQISLQLKLKENAKTITIKTVKDNEQIEETTYSLTDSISLVNEENTVYVIHISYPDDSVQFSAILYKAEYQD